VVGLRAALVTVGWDSDMEQDMDEYGDARSRMEMDKEPGVRSGEHQGKAERRLDGKKNSRKGDGASG